MKNDITVFLLCFVLFFFLPQTWKNEGFFALYKGFWPNWLRLGPWNIIVSFSKLCKTIKLAIQQQVLTDSFTEFSVWKVPCQHKYSLFMNGKLCS